MSPTHYAETIHTQEELASKTPDELAWLRRIGKKSQQLVTAMHQIAICQTRTTDNLKTNF